MFKMTILSQLLLSPLMINKIITVNIKLLKKTIIYNQTDIKMGDKNLTIQLVIKESIPMMFL